MLVISRKPNQLIRISDDIVVRVLEVRGNDVKIGIEAPKHIAIMRGELTGPCLKIVPLDKDQNK
jgi:carbon storage regulator